jgi:hypothetical protein
MKLNSQLRYFLNVGNRDNMKDLRFSLQKVPNMYSSSYQMSMGLSGDLSADISSTDYTQPKELVRGFRGNICWFFRP